MDQLMLKGLQHNVYDKRKANALELEKLVKELTAAPSHENDKRLRQIIAQLYELAAPRTAAGVNSNYTRSGGMMGLAGVAIALGDNLAGYLGAIIQPVLSCFEDPDSKVRYFACESMYNIARYALLYLPWASLTRLALNQQAKVAQGEVLLFFNELFDVMSKVRIPSFPTCTSLAYKDVLSVPQLAADTDMSVKNGAELLDRLLKDIVSEQASTYISLANFGASPSSSAHNSPRPDSPGPSPGSTFAARAASPPHPSPPQLPAAKAFSLSRLVPLLHERIYVLNPFTRTFLISWLIVLDSVPDLQLISFFPDFLEGLLRYLGDPTVEVRVSTEGLLEGLLREVRAVREVEGERRRRRRAREEMEEHTRRERRMRRRPSEAKTVRQGDEERDGESTLVGSEAAGEGSTGGEGNEEQEADEEAIEDEEEDDGEVEESDFGEDDWTEWQPGEGVRVDYAAVVEILIQHLSFPDEEIQSTCLHWISEFLQFVPGVLVPFAPRLIPVILSSLAHHVPAIQQAASDTNDQLFAVVQSLPEPRSPQHPQPPQQQQHQASPSNLPPTRKDTSPTLIQQAQTQAERLTRERTLTASPPPSSIPFPSSATSATPRPGTTFGHDRHKPGSDASILPQQQLQPQPSSSALTAAFDDDFPPLAHDHERDDEDIDEYELNAWRFQYGATVNELTLQFLSENEETRVAALEWLLMLHQKAPRKVCSRGGSAPAPGSGGTGARQRHPSSSSTTSSGLSLALLLKMLSDPSERVLRYDLQLLAQISASASEEDYFPSFMRGLLDLFSTDRKLLEQKGSLIIRQLCGSLNAERIYRTCAELLEKDEDLEFASIMVQNLNLIMITSPELSDFRKRLRTLDSKDGQNLFTSLYRSWSHNAVATFTLCLLAQAYEQACALLQILCAVVSCPSEAGLALTGRWEMYSADLEITVPLLIQIDKLVQLLESPVFTSLRLQLLEPEKYPFLLKAMYGLLMLLPQSSAFATLRNRLSAVSSLGPFLGSNIVSPSSTTSTPSSALTRRDTPTSSDPSSIRWNDLLAHFRHVQKRRAAFAASAASPTGTSTAPAGQGGSMMSFAQAVGGVGTNGLGGAGDSIDGQSTFGLGIGTGGAGGSVSSGSRILGGGGVARRKLTPGGPGRSDTATAGGGGGGGGGFMGSGGRTGGVRVGTGTSGSGSGMSLGGGGRESREGSATPVSAQRPLSPTPGGTKRRVGSGLAGGGAWRKS
ncbi:SPOSA6832_00602 [Sporobolomyces salmonicolor]|uniref:SPOSA6832_00602-mRNA-1:cds n=1 Tax=Sporidiobolus salmonicolor TaxID=5005 RepID=A0A0D6EGK8_SPOSA|nr:SPOSA6832_00602 [Sporobolomyces salmonicolor]